MLDYFFSLNLLWRTDLLKVGAFLHVNYFCLSRMHITFFIVTLSACATCHSYPCTCTNKRALSWRLLFFKSVFTICFDLDLYFLHDVMASCDKCSLDYFQVSTEFIITTLNPYHFYNLIVFYLLKQFVHIAVLSVLTVRISIFGAVENLLLFLKLRSGHFVIFLFPILKEHLLPIPIFLHGKYYYLLNTFLGTCGTTELYYCV